MLSVLVAVALAAGTGDSAALVDAAKNADKAAVRALVQKKVDVNAAEPDGTTALHWASYRDDLETVDLLIRAGAKVNAATDLRRRQATRAAQPLSPVLEAPGRSPERAPAISNGSIPSLAAASATSSATTRTSCSKATSAASAQAANSRGKSSELTAST